MNLKSRISDIILLIGYLIILCGIFLGTLFSWDFYNVQENRVLAKKPVLQIGNIKNIPSQVEEYLNDHFGFRNTLIRRYSKLRERYFGFQLDNVIIGRQGWLFLNESITDYLGYQKFSEKELEKWRLVLEGRRAWLKERGIYYVFVIPPNKQTIYSEYLPDEIAASGGETRFDALLAYMKNRSDLPILDLRDTLRKAKTERLIYTPTDTHWNDYGQFACYQALILYLKGFIPGISDPMTFKEENYIQDTYVGDLVGLGGLAPDDYPAIYSRFKPENEYFYTQSDNNDEWITEAKKRNGTRDLIPARYIHNPEGHFKVVLFHDSFMQDFPKWLAFNFEDVYSLPVHVEYDTLKKAVEEYHPDIVIDETVERFLHIVLDDHSTWAKAGEGGNHQ